MSYKLTINILFSSVHKQVNNISSEITSRVELLTYAREKSLWNIMLSSTIRICIFFVYVFDGMVIAAQCTALSNLGITRREYAD